MKLHTIGYEGQSQVSFAALLEEYGIRRVVDVREIPLSHKPGFSKTRLHEFLRTIDVDYIHMQVLGCPRQIRHDYRADHDWERYKSRYLEFLATREKELLVLMTLVEEMPSCLLCFEADHYRCHRSFIAARLAEISTGKLDVAPIIPGQVGEMG